MQSIIKKQNHQSEKHFHDEWAKAASIDEIDIVAQFEGETSPEYKEAIRLLGDVKGKTILNIGCGLGEETVYLSLKGAKVVAIDTSSEMLKFTKKLAEKYRADKKISYFQMSVEKIKFDREMFDYVLGCNILHHIDITKAVKEICRVLKKSGIAVFIEPLTYNPVINIYRAMAYKVRTDDEHPLTYNEINQIKKIFPNFFHKEYQLFTLLIFIWFFIGEWIHPNKSRYWKKIISESHKYENYFKILFQLDKFLLKTIPFLRRYCWVTVIRVQK